MRRGHTLAELCTTLLILTVGVSFVAPAARHLQDRMAVVAAREAVAGLVAEARVQAMVRGSAVVVVETSPATVSLESPGRPSRRIPVQADLGVEIALSRGRPAAELRYNVLGLGQVASETVSFRRGRAVAALVVSGYGRVRRR
jgi:Tfp pilus assembly protein FimT